MMDISESLKSTENTLRDLFHFVLSEKLGTEWIKSCGICEDKLSKWRKRQKEEQENLGYADTRLIYYADFYDLEIILNKNWNNGLSNIFGEKKEINVFLKILHNLRNPDAHRRELLPYQKYLAIGITGKIRTDVTRYFSKMETGDSYYPRIQSIQDNLGNTWSIGNSKSLNTGCKLRPNDLLQFTVSATDPMGDVLEYLVIPCVSPFEGKWSKEGNFDVIIKNNYIGEQFFINILVRSPRDYHAINNPVLGHKVDDNVAFMYEVLPPRT